MSSVREPVTPQGERLLQPALDETARATRRALALLVVGGICLGLSPVLVKAMPLPAEVSAFYRVALSAPLLLGFIWLMDHGSKPRPSSPPQGGPSGRLYILAAVLFAADLLAMHVAIRLTNASVATLFTNCAPFFVGVFGLLGLADRPTRAFWTALPLGLVGTALIVGVSAFGTGGNLLGDAIALLAGVLYGAYLVTVRRLKQQGASSAHVIAAVTTGSAILLAPAMLAHESLLPPDGRTVVLLILLVLVGQVAGQGLVTVALRSLPVTSSSMVLLIQPVVAAPLAFLVLGETLTPLQLAGMALVLVSIGLATRPQHSG